MYCEQDYIGCRSPCLSATNSYSYYIALHACLTTSVPSSHFSIRHVMKMTAETKQAHCHQPKQSHPCPTPEFVLCNAVLVIDQNPSCITLVFSYCRAFASLGLPIVEGGQKISQRFDWNFVRGIDSKSFMHT